MLKTGSAAFAAREKPLNRSTDLPRREWGWFGCIASNRMKAPYAAISGSRSGGSARPSGGDAGSYSTTMKCSDPVTRSTSVVSSLTNVISSAGTGVSSSISQNKRRRLIACGNTPNSPATWSGFVCRPMQGGVVETLHDGGFDDFEIGEMSKSRGMSSDDRGCAGFAPGLPGAGARDLGQYRIAHRIEGFAISAEQMIWWDRPSRTRSSAAASAAGSAAETGSASNRGYSWCRSRSRSG